MVIGLIPIVGGIYDVVSLALERDLISGWPMNTADRAIMTAGLLFRTLGFVDEVLEGGSRLLRHLDELDAVGVGRGLSYLDEFTAGDRALLRGNDLRRALGGVDEGGELRRWQDVTDAWARAGADLNDPVVRRLIQTEPLIYAGHVGESFNGGKNIYGFTPFAPGLSNSQVIELLKQHRTFPGQVLDDTMLFHRAQDLAEQGYRTQVYVQSILVPHAEFDKIRRQVLSEVENSPLPNKRYAFPGPEGCFNCAIWPSSHGIPIPESSGNLRLYVKELIKVGVPWRR